MAATATEPTTPRHSGLVPGLGFMAIVNITMDNAYAFGGEYCNLSAIFPNQVFGGHVIADPVDCGGFVSKYVAGATPTSGLIQVFAQVTAAAGTCGPLNECLTTESLSMIDGQVWCFYGR